MAGVLVLLIGGFVIFKIIQAIAAFVDALEGRPEEPIEDDAEDEERQK